MQRNKFKNLVIISFIAVLLVCAISVLLPLLLKEDVNSSVLIYEKHAKNINSKSILLNDYIDYLNFINDVKIKKELSEKDYKKHKYVVAYLTYDKCGEEIIGIKVKKITAKKIYIEEKRKLKCNQCESVTDIVLIQVSNDTKYNVKVKTNIKTTKDPNCK